MVVPAEPVLKPQSYAEKSPMGSVRGSKSAAPKETSSMDILSQALKNKGVPDDQIQQFLGSLAALIKGNMARLVQIGNTVFMLAGFDNDRKQLPEDTVNIIPYSVEPDDLIVERLRVLPNTLREMGVKKFIMMADDASDLQALQAAGIKFNTKQSQTISGNQAVPALIAEVIV